MSSPERAWWRFLAGILDAMKTADELDVILRAVPVSTVPTAMNTRRGACLDLGAVTEDTGGERPGDLAVVGPLTWSAPFVITVWTADPGGTPGRDIVAGTDALPGILDLAARVRDVVDVNMRETDALRWRWPQTIYSVLEEYPRQRAEMYLEIVQSLPAGNRAGGTFPAPTVPPADTIELADLADVDAGAVAGDVLQRTATAWVPRTAAEAGLATLADLAALPDPALNLGDLEDVAPGAEALDLLQLVGSSWTGRTLAEVLPTGVSLTTGAAPWKLPLFTADPVGVVNGDAWLVLEGGAVKFRYKREDTGALVSVVLS